MPSRLSAVCFYCAMFCAAVVSFAWLLLALVFLRGRT